MVTEHDRRRAFGGTGLLVSFWAEKSLSSSELDDASDGWGGLCLGLFLETVDKSSSAKEFGVGTSWDTEVSITIGTEELLSGVSGVGVEATETIQTLLAVGLGVRGGNFPLPSPPSS